MWDGPVVVTIHWKMLTGTSKPLLQIMNWRVAFYFIYPCFYDTKSNTLHHQLANAAHSSDRSIVIVMLQWTRYQSSHGYAKVAFKSKLYIWSVALCEADRYTYHAIVIYIALSAWTLWITWMIKLVVGRIFRLSHRWLFPGKVLGYMCEKTKSGLVL